MPSQAYPEDDSQRAVRNVKLWRTRKRRESQAEAGLPSDIVAAYARLLIAERESHESREAADAAAAELDRLIGEKGLIAQIEDQAQWSRLLESTAQTKAERYETMSQEFDSAVAEVGFPPGWTPEGARKMVEQQLMT